MSTWIKNHKSKYKTVYTAAIENFNKFSPKRLKALREGGSPQQELPHKDDATRYGRTYRCKLC